MNFQSEIFYGCRWDLFKIIDSENGYHKLQISLVGFICIE